MEEQDQEEQDPYKWGFLYYNKSDPRTLVPKGSGGIGLTLNFARFWSYIIMLFLIGMIVFVFVDLVYFPPPSTH